MVRQLRPWWRSGPRKRNSEFLRRSEIYEGQKKGYNKFTGEASEGAEGAASSSKAEPEAVDLSSFSYAQQEALMRQIQENLENPETSKTNSVLCNMVLAEPYPYTQPPLSKALNYGFCSGVTRGPPSIACPI